MAATLRPHLRFSHLRRYGEIGRLLVKYGRGDLAEEAGFELADDLESLGPTFVKLGQLLSTRPDIVPPDFAEALTRLQDDVAPMPWADVERVFTEDLGLTPDEVFEHFEREPLASASLGQVHRARLANGHEVVVKVQRPDARARVEEDMAAISELAQLVDGHTDVGKRMGFRELVAQFADTIDAELDYRREASHLERLAEIVSPYDRLVVPAPVRESTTQRVLTMDHVEGRKVTTLTPVGRTSIDGEALTEQLFRAYLDQILVHGFFHADPHPGNVLLTEDNKLALLDLGMVATVSPRFQDALVRLLVAAAEGRGEEAGRVTVAMGTPLEDFDEPAFLRGAAALVAKAHGTGIGDADVGTLVMELNRVAFESGLRQPPELAMLGKALLNLDQIAAQLDPSFDPSACIRDHAESIMVSRMRPSRERLYATALDAREFIEELPGRVNRLLDAAAGGDLKVKVDAIDEESLLRSMRQVANRVTMGLVLAALIIGAALLARVESSIATVCFVLAAIGGFALVVSIAWEGWRARRSSS